MSVLEDTICETRNHNKNLTAALRELLQWHFPLGCILRFLPSTVRLLVKNHKAVVNCDKVKCAYFKFGKNSLLRTKTQTVVKDKSNYMELKKNYLVPGHLVSVDHFQSAPPG